MKRIVFWLQNLGAAVAILGAAVYLVAVVIL